MSAKRFRFNGRTNCIEYDNESILLDSYGEDIEELLNELHEENEQLKYNLYDHMVDLNNYTGKCSALEIENEQLKQRNDRQAKRLAELYELMAKKDWESLTEIIDDFCSCEEQLQRKWRTYK